MNKKVFIKSFGCQMNVRDSEVICGLLKKSGFAITDEEDNADVVIFNTCSVRQHAEDKVWSEVGRIAKLGKRSVRAPNGKPLIGVVGCMAQNHREKIFERAEAVDFVVGPLDIEKIPGIVGDLAKKQLLYDKKIWETDGVIRPEEVYHTGFYQDKEHAYVVISEGCSNFCSYCVVPFVRGAMRSRKSQDILEEIRQAIDKGISTFTLLGQNVNAYECDGTDFIRLIGSVNAIKGLREFSFITSHPKDTSTDLFKAMADSAKLKKYLHLPVQAGSDRILALMNRGYTRKFYLALADNYRTIVKGSLTSDIIVGFPSENEEDFKETYDLVKTAEFDAAYIFKYSPRPHAQAAQFEDSVPREEKERRHKAILDLQKKISKKIKK